MAHPVRRRRAIIPTTEPYVTNYRGVCGPRNAVVAVRVVATVGLPERVASPTSVHHSRIGQDGTKTRATSGRGVGQGVVAHELQGIRREIDDVRKGNDGRHGTRPDDSLTYGPFQYDVLAAGETGGGGEYTPQTGFGWTNGLVLELLNRWGDSAVSYTSNNNGETTVPVKNVNRHTSNNNNNYNAYVQVFANRGRFSGDSRRSVRRSLTRAIYFGANVFEPVRLRSARTVQWRELLSRAPVVASVRTRNYAYTPILERARSVYNGVTGDIENVWFLCLFSRM